MYTDLILHLSLIKGVGPVSIMRIMHQMGPRFLDEIYTWSISNFVHSCGLSEAIATLIVRGLAQKDLLHKEQDLLNKHNIGIITILDDQYSSVLKEIYAPPVVLYVQGDISLLSHKALAVIGSRQAQKYAQSIIEAWVPELIESGWVIVSGGALGADSMAHQAALQAQGKTVVVLGSGLLRPYPQYNIKLFRDIVAQGGAVISPFNLMMDAAPGNFPARNRIISGLSRGCFVVQAAAKSGASITAHCALEQGREVFALPGSVHDELSAGCHALIQKGAKLVMSVQDILAEFGENQASIAIKSVSKTDKQQPITLVSEHPLISLCKEPIAVDDLILTTNYDLATLQIELFNLQLEGKVQQNFMGLWQTL